MRDLLRLDLTCGNVTGAAVCSADNTVNASVNGCACTNDTECAGNCNQTTHTCGGVTNAQVCSIGNGVDACANGCPCSNNSECQGGCVGGTKYLRRPGRRGRQQPAGAIRRIQRAARESGQSGVRHGHARGRQPRAAASCSLNPPTAADCTGASVHSVTAPVSGNNAYPSTMFMTAQTGCYRWVARYTGHAYNLGVTGLRDDGRQTVFIGPRLIFRNGFETPPPP